MTEVQLRQLVIITILVLATPVTGARGGAWTQPPGGFYQKLEAATTRTDREYDASGRQTPFVSGLTPAEYRRTEVRWYGEYGLAAGWTVVGSLTWQTGQVEELAARFRTRGLSDARLGLRRGLGRGPWVTSAALEVKIPTGYEPADFPALGTGDPDAGAALLAGRGLGRAYVTGELGYRVRGGAPHDEVPFSAELGWSPGRRLQLRGTVRGRISLAGAGDAGTIDPASADSREFDLQGAAAVRLSHRWDLETSAVTSLAGRHSLARTEFAVGVAWHR